MPPNRRRRPGPDDLSAGEYVTLVVLVASALVVTVMFVTWTMEKRGMLAPGTTPRLPTTNGNGPDGIDYSEHPHGAEHIG